MQGEELMPCPFCGCGLGEFDKGKDDSGEKHGFWVGHICHNGTKVITAYFPTEFEALAAWNRRHTDPDTVRVPRDLLEWLIGCVNKDVARLIGGDYFARLKQAESFLKEQGDE